MNRLDKIKQEFFKRFQNKLAEEDANLSIESAFDILISADPSRNKKNVRWLMETYLDDGYLFEDIQSGEYSKVHETLNVFIRNKNKLDILDRSINRYQSIADMWKMVKQYADDKTGKEVKREEYDKAMAESEVIVDNDDIRVVVPLTEYAAKFHGRGTRWCTAATKTQNMFASYAQYAPLYIITLKDNGDKLQFYRNRSNIQFMDADDKNVSNEYIKKNWNLLKCVISFFGIMEYVPEKYRTIDFYNTCRCMQYPTLNHMPKDIWKDMNPHDIYDLCERAIKYDYYEIFNIPNNYISHSQKYKLYKLACEQNGCIIYDTPRQIITYKLCKIACKSNGLVLRDIPKRFITPELCQIAVEQDGNAIEFVPDMTSNGLPLKTPELCMKAYKNTKNSLLYFQEYATYDLYKETLLENGIFLKFIPEEYKNEELYKIAVKQNGMALEFIPDEFITYELCVEAVKNIHLAINIIPEKYMTYEVYAIALSATGYYIRSVPQNIMSYELALIAVSNYSGALQYIDKKYWTHELLKIAATNVDDYIEIIKHNQYIDIIKELSMITCKVNAENIQYVPDKYKTYEMAYHVVHKKGYLINYIPDTLITEQLIKLSKYEESCNLPHDKYDQMIAEFRNHIKSYV